MIYFHMQRFNFIDFMVIELRFFKNNNNNNNNKKKKKKKKKMENMAKILKVLFKLLHTSYIITQPILVYWLFLTHSSP